MEKIRMLRLKLKYGFETCTFLFFLLCPLSWCQSDRLVTSPDGQVKLHFSLLPGGIPVYRIDYMEKPMVLESRMGFPGFNRDFEVTGISTRSYEGQWINRFGERRIIPDQYQELIVDMKHASGKLLQIIFRTYNEGAAFRYSLPQQETQTFVFPDEQTEFRFPAGTWGYEEHGTEGEYKRSGISEIQPYCERPLTLEYAHGLWASLAEAANFSYPRMLLSPLEGSADALVSALGGNTSNTPTPNQRHDPTITLQAGQSSPWRMLVVGNRPGDLLERNYLMLNLNPPCVLEDTSWIKPGKVMRDTTLTTANSKAIVDFATAGGLRYVHLDAGWYGPEDTQTGDATTARRDNLDIQEIIRYGREKNVGLIVYVDRRQIRKQRDILFPLYEKWGIKGVKIGFIDIGPQTESRWITETIAKAAEHHLMLNIHDGYRASGNNRTYPNLMTVEGIRGNEHMPTPEHNCTLPFTRYIAGIGDYTICYYENRLKTTHAHQLAMAVVSFSPLQWIYWYDSPNEYNGEPEIEFFQVVPTVWDETKVVDGQIGEYAVIARRSGDNWFIGTINNLEPRHLKIPLFFLDENKKYTASIYSDDESAQTKTKIGIDRRPVNSKTVLEAPLVAGGGQAVWIKLL
ncbi:MAG TPA: glycoside hydrolase family 97 catalytic domain-containing protein [Anaerohalosphaeraceae bacterium]|nr:glycoside hydrolase family 97 catalytic domain-containing protein [Anaerohalosphaeraceae bacterium]HRS71341.1 glycoside hydrolase family 97 catalytic domain-containing protein [Anaerohalosphaeraceae bacterium]